MMPSLPGRRPATALLAGAAVLAAATLALGQNFTPPTSKPPGAEVLDALRAKTGQLGKIIDSLRKQGVHDPGLAELEIYHKAALWAVKQNEFYQPQSAQWIMEALDRGLVRARLASQGEMMPWVNERGHAVVRAYRSRVDDSVQPYAVILPADYGRDPRKKWRLDIVLHGRDDTLTEVKFLHQFNGDKDAPAHDFVELHVYGRGNNAYRWAGETDVFEAADNFLGVERLLGRAQLLDPARVVLRGFSMGGAGTWHLGLHHPDRWCALGPGAGFTKTRGYVPKLGTLTPVQEACLHIYDAVDYAENVFDVPVVAYAGEKDKQLQAARNIEARLKELNVPKGRLELLIAPGLKHQFPETWQAKMQQALGKFVAGGRKTYPGRVRFVTYTMKYPSCFWVDILGLERHYDRAEVDAEKTETGYTIKTANVRGLHLTLPEDLPEGWREQQIKVAIDGQSLTARAWTSPNSRLHVYLQRRAGRWSAALPQKVLTGRARVLQKLTNLQGPIDDAFMESFLCVRGTGKPWHDATLKYADARLEQFQREWAKHLRGELPVKDDTEVTDRDIATKNLILFGDPASNSLIAAVLDELPLEWTRESITLAGRTFDAAGHVPVLIYPSPLNAQRYVVLNTGHTFHAADFEGTNALLYPRLGDYAVLKLAPTEKDPLHPNTELSGLYDDFWRVGKR